MVPRGDVMPEIPLLPKVVPVAVSCTTSPDAGVPETHTPEYALPSTWLLVKAKLASVVLPREYAIAAPWLPVIDDVSSVSEELGVPVCEPPIQIDARVVAPPWPLAGATS